MNEAQFANERRAFRARAALNRYKRDQLHEDGPVCDDTVVDFLTDLFHYNNDRGDLQSALDTARMHYDAEKV